MPDRRRRAAPGAVRARQRAIYLAGRLGIGVRECRIALGLRQGQAAGGAGVSQPFWSRLERGRTTAVTLETLAANAAAVDAQLAAFIEARPGADLPRDIEHLRRQELVLRIARGGGWAARPERSIDPAWSRSRSIDLLLERSRAERREIIDAEIEDWLADVGGSMRGLGDKVVAIRRQAPDAIVAGLLIVRQTARNRRLLSELAGLFEGRFPAPGSTWLAALTGPTRPMPAEDGWVWSTVAGDRVVSPRVRDPRRRARGSAA